MQGIKKLFPLAYAQPDPISEPPGSRRSRAKFFKLHPCSAPTHIAQPDHMQIKKRPLLFIHGAEYRSEDEVMRDLVLPFFRNARLSVGEGSALFDIFFVSWNSSFFCEDGKDEVRRLHAHRNWFLRSASLMRFCSRFFEDLESRADQAALSLAPFAGRLLDGHALPPLIVTHSLGAYVWSRFLANYLRCYGEPPQLGTWWSLQPALPSHAFHTGGLFADLPRLYERLGGHYELWYSRLDWVLRFLYPLFKRHRALGQTGCAEKNFGLQFDLTDSVREAHGGITLMPGHGDFMSRVSGFLQARMQWELVRIGPGPSFRHPSAAV